MECGSLKSVTGGTRKVFEKGWKDRTSQRHWWIFVVNYSSSEEEAGSAASIPYVPEQEAVKEKASERAAAAWKVDPSR